MIRSHSCDIARLIKLQSLLTARDTSGMHEAYSRVRLPAVQRYFGTAVGKNRQAAKTEIEKLKLEELACQQGVVEVAKM